MEISESNRSPHGSLQIGESKRIRNSSFCLPANSCNDNDRERSAKKFFLSWRQACDKTKDRTKELLKRTLSWKDTQQMEFEDDVNSPNQSQKVHGWSVHVWKIFKFEFWTITGKFLHVFVLCIVYGLLTTYAKATWVKRSMEEIENTCDIPINLSAVQRDKFTQFFYYLLDSDRDDLISVHDFCNLSEKLRHFADWSESSLEFSVLQQVQQGFVAEFFTYINKPGEKHTIQDEYISLDDWLRQWSNILTGAHILKALPFWLQHLPRVIFTVINKSGSCVITKDELRTFYISVIGINPLPEHDLLKTYDSMTANSDYKLNYSIYELCFSNWLFCTGPNGPGQWIFGKCGTHPEYFPIDYSTLNTSPEDREAYTPDKKTNRFSVVV